MAAKTTVTKVCDMPHDGDVEARETIRLAVGSKSGVLDLCDADAAAFREVTGPWLAALHPVRGRVRTQAARRNAAAVRAWAERQPEWAGKLPARGRLSRAVTEAHDAAAGIL